MRIQHSTNVARSLPLLNARSGPSSSSPKIPDTFKGLAVRLTLIGRSERPDCFTCWPTMEPAHLALNRAEGIALASLLFARPLRQQDSRCEPRLPAWRASQLPSNRRRGTNLQCSSAALDASDRLQV